METSSKVLPIVKEPVDTRDRNECLTTPLPPINPPKRHSFLEVPPFNPGGDIQPRNATRKLVIPVSHATSLFRSSQGENATPNQCQAVVKVRNKSPRREQAFGDVLGTTSEYEPLIRPEKQRKVGKGLGKVDQIWGFIVFVCIVYNYLLFFFYLGISGTSSKASLVCEIFAELILLLDACIVTYLYFRQYEILKLLPIDHLAAGCSSEVLGLIILWISSYPQHTVNIISLVPPRLLSSLPFAFLRALKLLRYPEIWSYFDSQLRRVKGVNASYVKMIQYVLNICMLIHAATMLSLALVRLEENHDWLNNYGFNEASSLETYSQFLLLITSNMGGMCYGDTQPVTVIEMMIYCLIVYVGSTAFASLFGNIANSIYISNRRLIESRRKLEQIKNFVSTRGLPRTLKRQLRIYYIAMHPNFSKYQEHCNLLSELPKSLRTELTFRQNVGFIQKVKLFQLSDVSFIIALLRAMKPIICMAGDHIVRLGELADSMYFIKQGLAKVVCADDEKVIISYLGEGSYFGEIGVMMSGKRSTSVIAHTDCTLFSVQKEALLNVLKEFPHHKHFLELVGQQRLETTFTKDVQVPEATNSRSADTHANPHEISMSASTKSKSRKVVNKNEKGARWWDLTWTLTILGAIVWNVCYTLFALCFDVTTTEYKAFIILDTLALFIYALDLSHKLMIQPSTSNGERSDTFITNVTTGTLFELLAVLPIDYIYFAAEEYVTWLRLFRLLKIIRVSEIDTTLKSRFESYHMYNIVRLVFCFVITSHLFSCILYVIAKSEYEKGGRFDHTSLFTTIPQKYSSFKPIEEETLGIHYVHSIYIVICIMGSNISGDVIPTTPFEQFFASFATLISRLFVAFLYAEVSNLISGYYSAYIEHLNRTKLIVDWLKYNTCDKKIISRTERYRDILWNKCKGIDDQLLIMDMPETLRKETQLHILQHLVQNADVIPKNDAGSVLSLIQRLSIKIFPRGEFIILEGEIALDMYFLIEGIVDIYGREGKKIGRLTTGKCFGEMALLKERVQTRMASAYCATDVTVAVFKKEDFALICDSYPLFKERVAEIVQERERHNLAASIANSAVNKNKDEPDTNRELLPQPETSPRLTPPKPQASLTLSAILEARTLNDEKLFAEINNGKRERVGTCGLLYTLIQACVCIYNVFFIPLQMAFRIEYTPTLYSLEALIMVLFGIDIAIRIQKYKKYNTVVFAEEQVADMEESKWVPNKNEGPSTIARKRQKILRMIIFECFTFLPWSLILQNVYYPTYVIFVIKMVRVMKIWPIRKLLSLLKKKWPNPIRICEVVVLYTAFAHIMACSFILMMYVPETKNESWVKLVPYPLTGMKGYREGDDMTGVSNMDIYFHAIYFAYTTFTHISVGDICAVNIQERILMCIYVFISFHGYAFLFANITSMITDLSRGLLSNLQQKYEEALRCVKVGALPSTLASRIKAYFDFLWVDTRGIDDNFLSDLPINLKTDIHLQLYQNAIKNCVLFKRPNGEFDKPAASSFLKLVTLRKCMKGDILAKAGSSSSKMFFLLEGELLLIGMSYNKIGLISPGILLDSRAKEGSNRQMVHVVATKISTVAVVGQKALEIFLEAFPHIKASYELASEAIYKKCKACISLSESTPEDIERILENVQLPLTE